MMARWAMGWWVLVVGIAACVGPGVVLADGNDAAMLWYRAPAREWVQALPVGNGRMGAMVFGGVPQERIQFNEETLWDGYFGRNQVNPRAKESLPKVRELLFSGRFAEAEQLIAETMPGVPPRILSYQTFGDITITYRDGRPGKHYRRALDPMEGVAVSRFEIGGTPVTQRVFASHPDDCVVIRIEAERSKDAVDCLVRMSREQDAQTDVLGDHALLLHGRINRPHDVTGEPMGLFFAARLTAYPEGKKAAARPEEGGLRITGAKAVTLILEAATSWPDRPEKVERLKTPRADAAPDFGDMLARHRADLQSLMGRVRIDLPRNRDLASLPTDQRLRRVKRGDDDPSLLALYFQYGRYLLVSSSRSGDLPANLQGVWCEHFEAPWNSDYHTNINLQMNYWPAEVTALPECHLPLFDYMAFLKPYGEQVAREMYGARGWVLHHISDLYGFAVPADGVWGMWPMGGAWLATHCWEHYLFTGDVAFLRDRGYPLMRDAAVFMLDFLVRDQNGVLQTAPSHSPENHYLLPDGTQCSMTYSATMDIAILRQLFAACVEASKVLDTDPGTRAAWQEALEHLPPFRISPRTGALMEWVEDFEEAEPGHRHMSHLYGLHPADLITRETPDLYAAARATIERRLRHGGGHTGWSRAWIVNFYARLGDGKAVGEHLHALLAKSTLPNLFDDHPPFQIDGNFGGTAGIAEALLQSHRSVIRLLPGLPPSWDQGRVEGLKARGNVTVSIAWKRGQLDRADLVPARPGPVTVWAPWAFTVVTGNGKGEEVARAEADPLGGWRTSWTAAGGQSYRVTAH